MSPPPTAGRGQAWGRGSHRGRRAWRQLGDVPRRLAECRVGFRASSDHADRRGAALGAPLGSRIHPGTREARSAVRAGQTSMAGLLGAI